MPRSRRTSACKRLVYRDPCAEAEQGLNWNQEFAKLKDGETIYKLIGPVLLKQDQTEAESTVNGRLEFIDKEMYVHHTPLAEMKLTQAHLVKIPTGTAYQGDTGEDGEEEGRNHPAPKQRPGCWSPARQGMIQPNGQDRLAV